MYSYYFSICLHAGSQHVEFMIINSQTNHLQPLLDPLLSVLYDCSHLYLPASAQSLLQLPPMHHSIMIIGLSVLACYCTMYGILRHIMLAITYYVAMHGYHLYPKFWCSARKWIQSIVQLNCTMMLTFSVQN